MCLHLPDEKFAYFIWLIRHIFHGWNTCLSIYFMFLNFPQTIFLSLISRSLHSLVILLPKLEEIFSAGVRRNENRFHHGFHDRLFALGNFNFNSYLYTLHITQTHEHHLILISTWILILLSWVGHAVLLIHIFSIVSGCHCVCFIEGKKGNGSWIMCGRNTLNTF